MKYNNVVSAKNGMVGADHQNEEYTAIKPHPSLVHLLDLLEEPVSRVGRRSQVPAGAFVNVIQQYG